MYHLTHTRRSGRRQAFRRLGDSAVRGRRQWVVGWLQRSVLSTVGFRGQAAGQSHTAWEPIATRCECLDNPDHYLISYRRGR